MMEAGSSGGGAGSKPVVCFLGPISSYTHQATMEAFPAEQFDLMPVTTIKDIFDTTQSGAATYGVVPFENSTNGSVVFTLDNFADRAGAYADLNVCREIYLDVHHCLLGHPPSTTTTTTTNHSISISSSGVSGSGSGGSKNSPLHDLTHIRRIYSHPQAFGQCRAFLGTWLRGIETVDVSSTSRAAELAQADPSGESAAVSSAVAADMFGLEVLARNIEDRDDNTTRFFVLRRGVGEDVGGDTTAHRIATSISTTTQTDTETGIEKEKHSEVEEKRTKESAEQNKEGEEEDDDAPLLRSTKSLISFTVPHQSPGALADVLSCFRRGGLNLTSINSRPSLLPGAAAFEYIFFVECEGHRFRDPRGRVAGVLRDVGRVADGARWLGSWEDMRMGRAR
ncbi:Prephenate dehydratase-domain-containing protein [Nemania sp. FL0916]|nr:Prephenate dehydratase-domain-containing protein [Nemania sp. FL0916]